MEACGNQRHVMMKTAIFILFCMKTKTFLLATIILMSWLTGSGMSTANADNVNDCYRISYMMNSYLYQKDKDMNLINMDLEWPERLNNSDAVPLQNYLCNFFFGKKASSFNAGLTSFVADKGKRLFSMPDDEGLNKHYITFKLREVALSGNRYVSLNAMYDEYSNDTTMVPVRRCKLFTYDMVNGKILTIKDIIRSSKLSDEYSMMQLKAAIIFASNINEDIDWASLPLPGDVCLGDSSVDFDSGLYTDENNFNIISRIPMTALTPFLTKSIKNYLSTVVPLRIADGDSAAVSTADKALDNSQSSINYGDTATVYTFAEQMPEFICGKDSMMSYLSKSIVYHEDAIESKIAGRVVVSFIVEKDGSLSHFCVIKPLSAELDREVIRAVSSMPKWTPGKIDNVPVRVKQMLPISFRVGK
jgi:TonB family protein